MMKIVETTDGRFLGREFDETLPIVLDKGTVFVPDKVELLPDNGKRFSNSSYVIDTIEV